MWLDLSDSFWGSFIPLLHIEVVNHMSKCQMQLLSLICAFSSKECQLEDSLGKSPLVKIYTFLIQKFQLPYLEWISQHKKLLLSKCPFKPSQDVTQRTYPKTIESLSSPKSNLWLPYLTLKTQPLKDYPSIQYWRISPIQASCSLF